MPTDAEAREAALELARFIWQHSDANPTDPNAWDANEAAAMTILMAWDVPDESDER